MCRTARRASPSTGCARHKGRVTCQRFNEMKMAPGGAIFGKTRRLGHSPLGALRLRGYFLGSSLPQWQHLVAPSWISSRQYGQTGAGVASSAVLPASLSPISCALLNALTMAKTIAATIKKLMHAPIKAPKSILVPGTTSPEISVALPPAITEISGLMMLSVSEVTIAVNAPPIITPTAMSITLPRLMNSLNSLSNAFMVAPRSCGARVVTAPDKPGQTKKGRCRLSQGANLRKSPRGNAGR